MHLLSCTTETPPHKLTAGSSFVTDLKYYFWEDQGIETIKDKIMRQPDMFSKL